MRTVSLLVALLFCSAVHGSTSFARYFWRSMYRWHARNVINSAIDARMSSGVHPDDIPTNKELSSYHVIAALRDVLNAQRFRKGLPGMRAIDWRNKGLYFTNWQVRKNLQPPPDIEDTAYFVAYVSGCNELLEYRLKGMVDTSETAKEEQKIRITGSISAEILAHVTLKQRKMYQSLKAAADIDGSGGIRISNASPRGE